METPNFVNITYEYELYSRPIPKAVLEIEKSLSYLYLLTSNTNGLYTKFSFSREYLLRLESLGLEIPKIIHRSNVKSNWWGRLENLKTEQILNSTKYFIHLTNILNIKTGYVGEVDNIKNFIDFSAQEKDVLIIKNEITTSGQGHYIYRPNEKNEAYFTKYLNDQKNRYMNENFYAFKLCNKSYEKSYVYFKNSLTSHYQFVGRSKRVVAILFQDDSLIDNKIRTFFSIFKDVFLTMPIVLDTLVDGNNQVFMELNYRKSLGVVFREFHNFINSKSSLFLMIRPEDLDHIKEFVCNDLKQQFQREILNLSPENIKIQCYVLCFSNILTVEEIKKIYNYISRI